ncbi:SGNH/GDSL hydrolase family protein [Nonomuraea sp. PA05]|uniref:SGNH/GDSL hydrolase family protein n=1 Tax=Nonomuraea sp. PA05 TaxID=2604466 RepID=UPI0011DB750D|nr:SGNH/GDSL hydrolase family protein [Nonomuraea sp. PA05]TYB54716.1 SGNH/GDSL hydrolase family protein [Nonomuraea sp. PA05]
MSSMRRPLTMLVPAVALVLATSGAAVATTQDRGQPAVTEAWSAAMQRPSAGFEPNWSETGFSDQSVRQVVRVTAAGSQVRIRLSNQYGGSPLKVAGATIARAGQGAAVSPGTLRHLTFGGGARSVVVPAGGEVVSDLAGLRVKPLESLTVTLYLPETTGPATTHLQGYATSYRASGDRRADTGGAAFEQGESTHSWYYLSGVEVSGAPVRRDTVVAIGDSITDGFGSGNDANTRYPDQLAARLSAAGLSRPVLNAGIGGGMVLSDSAWYGEKVGTRLDRDVLDNPRVGTLIVLAGLNDIGFSEVDLPTFKPNPDRSVAELIAGHRAIIKRAHAQGIEVIGGTLLPMEGAEYHTAESADKIHRLNQWIRTSGEYDAVVDFNKAVADPQNPERLRSAFDSGDHKHPNAAGYRAMADAFELDDLS